MVIFISLQLPNAKQLNLYCAAKSQLKLAPRHALTPVQSASHGKFYNIKKHNIMSINNGQKIQCTNDNAIYVQYNTHNLNRAVNATLITTT